MERSIYPLCHPDRLGRVEKHGCTRASLHAEQRLRRRSQNAGAALPARHPGRSREATAKGGTRRARASARISASRALASRLLAFALAVALASAGLPAPALAASAQDNSIAGDVGIALNVPAGTEVESRQTEGTFGVSLTIPPADEAGHREVTGDIGIRLAIPASDADEPREVTGTVGIRLTVPPADEQETRQSAGTMGIRLAIPAEGADEPREVTGTVGIRLTVPAADEVESREVTGDIGIRLSIPATHTVTFDATEGTFANTGKHTRDVRVAHGQSVADALAASSETVDDPKRPAHEFLGWFQDSACTVPYDFAWSVGGSITVFAGWSEIVDVTYNACGGEIKGNWDGTVGEHGGAYELAEDRSMLRWHDVSAGLAVHRLPAVNEDERRAQGIEFLGWWTRDSKTGAWIERVEDGEPAHAATKDLYARWVMAEVGVAFEDDDGSTLDGMRDDVILRNGKLPTCELSAVDAASEQQVIPVRPGYLLAGLWWGTGEDAVKYYDVSYTPGSSAVGTWVPGDAVGEAAGGWTQREHAVDTDDDQIADTVVLVARWDMVMSATVPVCVTFAVNGFGDSAPTVTTPKTDAFALRSKTPAEVTVSRIEAKGCAGIEDVFYTTGSGDARTLDYAAMAGVDGAGCMVLTLDAEGDIGTRTLLTLADKDGRAGAGAKPVSQAVPGAAFKLAAWDPSAGAGGTNEAKPSELHIKFGLALPDAVRAYESGATGEIARVTFTLATR